MGFPILYPPSKNILCLKVTQAHITPTRGKLTHTLSFIYKDVLQNADVGMYPSFILHLFKRIESKWLLETYFVFICHSPATT